MLRSTLSEMRKKFGILLNDAANKIEEGMWRLYDDARAEIFAGHNETTEEEYRRRVDEACAFLGRQRGLAQGIERGNGKGQKQWNLKGQPS